MPTLLSTKSVGLPVPSTSGKVREVYDLGEELLIVTTDRISAFDVIMANGIPDKGRILNQMSGFWFDKLANVFPSHVISLNDDVIAARLGNVYQELKGRSTLARKANPLPIECVVRGYISGSLFKEYKASGSNVHGLHLPPALQESERLPEPIFTPATKADEGHDQNLSWKETVDIVGKETAEQVREASLRLYREAAAHAQAKGLILADTKFEFGKSSAGLLWIDEALTPDSSRYWDASQYKPDGPQASFDKQFVRDYLESIGWNKQPPGPKLPEEVVERTRAKYIQAYKLVTGSELGVGS